MIELQALRFIYDGKVLLDNFSAHIRPYEKVVLYGASGTGKSTLLASLAGFVRPDKGKIYIQQMPVDPEHIQKIRRLIAWVPQEFSLPYQTVEEVMQAPFLLRNNQSARPAANDCCLMLEKLGLTPALYHKRLTEISGGQRQRVMIGIAALLNKKIILLDEPTSALDPESTRAIVRFLQELKEKTLVAVSHDPLFIDAFDRSISVGASSSKFS